MVTSKSATAEPNAACSSRDRAQRTRKEGSSPGRRRLKRPDSGKGERGRRDKGISQTGGSNPLAAADRPHERGFFALQYLSPREPTDARGVRRPILDDHAAAAGRGGGAARARLGVSGAADRQQPVRPDGQPARGSVAGGAGKQIRLTVRRRDGGARGTPAQVAESVPGRGRTRRCT